MMLYNAYFTPALHLRCTCFTPTLHRSTCTSPALRALCLFYTADFTPTLHQDPLKRFEFTPVLRRAEGGVEGSTMHQVYTGFTPGFTP
jgi:hypothetical protein